MERFPAALAALPLAGASLLMLFVVVRVCLLAGINGTSAGGSYLDPLAPNALSTGGTDPGSVPPLGGGVGDTRDWVPATGEGWSYRALLYRLEAAAWSDRISLRVIGEARYSGEAYPLVAVTISPASSKPAAARVLVTGGVHGDENAGAEAAVRFAELLARTPALFPEVAFDLIPVVNPWGWVYGFRQNGAGKDINRDFSSSNTQEAAIVRRYLTARIRENGAYQVALDHHSSTKEGYFVYQYTRRRAGLGPAFASLVEKEGKPLERGYREGGFAVRQGVLAIPAVALPYVSLLGRLSLEQWLGLHGTRHACTLESPLLDAFGDRVRLHLEATSAMVNDYLRKAKLVNDPKGKGATEGCD